MTKIFSTHFSVLILFYLSFTVSSTIANAQCTAASKPTFGYNFNGTNVFNVNNGFPDFSESASVTLCDGGQYFESGHFHSSSSNKYNLDVKPSGGAFLYNGFVPANAVITADEFSGLEGPVVLTLVSQNVGGSLIQTITPFTDLNNNGILDAGDCAGEPIVFTYTVTAKPIWYLDADNDHHASQTTRSCTSPGSGWTLTRLPVDDCNDNDPAPCPNKPPAVSLTSPARATNYVVPGPVRLSAVASDTDGTIRSVAFYNGSTLIFTEFKAPYSRQWRNVPTGSYSITAVATDNKGLKTTSAPVHITVLHNRPPTVSITSPVDSAVYGDHTSIVIRADAVSHGGKIKTVAFYSGATLLHIEEKLPYLWSWNNVPAGNYMLTAKATDTYKRTTTSAPVHVTVSSQCTQQSKPTFGYNFNGTSVFNINNGIPDLSESASVAVCNGGEYFESDRFHSSSANLYNLAVVPSGGILRFNGYVAADAVITAAQFDDLAGPVTITLEDPNTGGMLIQTITPFTDLNNNKILDAGDCAGDPLVFTYTASPCLNPPCPAASQPTFGFNFNGTSLFNINNGTADSSELTSISLCNGGQYNESGRYHSSSSNLYDVTYLTNGGTIYFNGVVVANVVLTAAEYNVLVGPVSVTLAEANVGGTVKQIITPFTDLNNNGIADTGDCAGEPIVVNFTVTPCSGACPLASQPTFGLNFNGTSVASINNGYPDSSESASIIVCDGGEYFTSEHFNSSASDLYDVINLPNGGTLLFNGFQVYNAVLTAAQLAGTAGTYTISLADPAVGGTLTQTITPFKDLNNNGILDNGDCAGDPLTFTYTASPCSANNVPALRKTAGANSKMDITSVASLQLSPNPANSILNVYVTGLRQNKQTTLSIISASGVVIKTVRSMASTQITKLNVSSLVSGTYFIKIISGDKVIYKQFVKM